MSGEDVVQNKPHLLFPLDSKDSAAKSLQAINNGCVGIYVNLTTIMQSGWIINVENRDLSWGAGWVAEEARVIWTWCIPIKWNITKSDWCSCNKPWAWHAKNQGNVSIQREEIRHDIAKLSQKVFAILRSPLRSINRCFTKWLLVCPHDNLILLTIPKYGIF